jgi:hypothetical protein
MPLKDGFQEVNYLSISHFLASKAAIAPKAAAACRATSTL